MFTRAEQEGIERLLRGTPFQHGQKWLVETHLDKGENGFGWGHYAQQDLVTTWGGTVDGIRGLLACGLSPKDPFIKRSVEWLISEQKEDGAFASKEITWSCVEAAAWVLRVLRQVEYNSYQNKLQKTCAFLEKCVKTNGGLGTSDKDQERIYPSTISLWALQGMSEKAFQIAEFLKRSVDSKSGGWGWYPKEAANAAMTAEVLYVLLLTGHLQADDAMCEQAVEFIISSVNAHGIWDNNEDEWPSIYLDRLADPIRCKHYTTAWAILALLEAGIKPFDHNQLIFRAASILVSKQLPEGAWLYNDTDINRFTWCTANALLCLQRVRNATVGPIVGVALEFSSLAISGNEYIPRISEPNLAQRIEELQQAEERQKQELMASLQRSSVREKVNLNTQLLIVIIVLILLHDPINFAIATIFSYLTGLRDSILSGIIANFLWIILLAIAAFIRVRLKKSHEES